MSRVPGSRTFLLVVAYLGFISLGLPDTLIGVAWPSVRNTFGLQQSSLGLIFVLSGVSYFLSSFFTGKLLARIGIGFLLAGSSLLVAWSGFGFSLAPTWLLFAGCALLHGLGSGAIDAGLNHYVAQNFSARHMTWLHACYSIGATLGPLIMTAVIAGSQQWRMGYATVATILLLLSILFGCSRKSWDAGSPSGASSGADDLPIGMAEALRHPTVLLQVALFFVYTGLEVTAGQWSFTLLTESRGIPRETAGLWVTLYWASIAVGRIAFGMVVERLGADRLIRLSLVLTLIGTVLLVANLGVSATVTALVLIGFGLAPIYPCMMTRTGEQLSRTLSAHAVGFQVSAAMIGAAALPSLAGFLAQRLGLETIALSTVAMAAVLFGLHFVLVLRARQTETAAQIV